MISGGVLLIELAGLGELDPEPSGRLSQNSDGGERHHRRLRAQAQREPCRRAMPVRSLPCCCRTCQRARMVDGASKLLRVCNDCTGPKWSMPTPPSISVRSAIRHCGFPLKVQEEAELALKSARPGTQRLVPFEKSLNEEASSRGTVRWRTP